MRKLLVGAAILALCFGATLWALNTFWPATSPQQMSLAPLPPLAPISRASQVIAPVAIATTAMRDVLENAAPRSLTGKRENPLNELLGKADIGWTIGRGPLSVAGRTEGVAVSAPLNGSLRVTGQIAGGGSNRLADTITGILGQRLGSTIGNLAQQTLDQRADIRGNVTVLSKPQLLANWRIEPNLTAQVAIADGGLSIAGFRVNVGNEVKPFMDRAVNEQITALGNQLRNDPTLEQTARREWAKLCRSISLGASSAGMPNLWLEMRPTKAFAGQPRIEPNWLILTLGIEADTRIVPNETKPDCPFPAQLQIVPQTSQGKLAIAVPIDLPFTELNKLMEAQLKGKTFPDDGSAAAQVTVLGAQMAAGDERLLISLRVKAREQKSWFGLGAEATVHIWGKPMLDRAQQILRLTNISLDVESEAAFGLLGTAARAALPALQSTLEEKAQIDLKPFLASALTSMQGAIAEFRKQADGVDVEASVKELRLVGIEFDSKTLRVIAEADGVARALVTKLH